MYTFLKFFFYIYISLSSSGQYMHGILNFIKIHDLNKQTSGFIYTYACTVAIAIMNVVKISNVHE